MFFLSCVCYAFVCVCLSVPCGHLLGKGLPLGSRLWCITMSCHFPIGILGQVWYLIVSIPDLCTLTYFRTQPTKDTYTIRIYHECEGGIEKSVPRITVWHHEASRVMTNGVPEGRIVLSYPHTNDGVFFLLTIVFFIHLF